MIPVNQKEKGWGGAEVAVRANAWSLTRRGRSGERQDARIPRGGAMGVSRRGWQAAPGPRSSVPPLPPGPKDHRKARALQKSSASRWTHTPDFSITVKLESPRWNW